MGPHDDDDDAYALWRDSETQTGPSGRPGSGSGPLRKRWIER